MTNDNHTIKYARLIELKENIGKYIKYDGAYLRYSDKWKTYERISVNRIKRAKHTAKLLNPNNIVYILFDGIPYCEINCINSYGGHSVKDIILIGENILEKAWTHIEGGKLKELCINFAKYTKIAAEYYIDEKYYKEYI